MNRGLKAPRRALGALRTAEPSTGVRERRRAP